ncbi:MAG TPA: bifunctional serine/threonine-protein kinase/formylglycine-generating enzyme family protein [Kofleriaceae bacterium]|nr:bifunctional serine/threonine-protein kinase/formylglycine-generating enzyme family protein [Kofleriaceae bacterium]
MIGETIGHFEITARLGRGGMGEVFVAEHTTIKTRVAIKILHAEVSTNTRQVQRFFNEAHAVARIQHAGIVKIFDVGFHTNQRAYLIMEHLEGETLAARIERTGRLTPRATAELARQIANILGATHHAGIIHRDLKPENVFLVRDREHTSGERVKLLDFGIAKLSDSIASANPTTAGTMGTPAYMAPEQWSDSSRVDWRADAYSLGCILYKMAAGRPPFNSASIAEACAKHLHETPQPIRSHTPDVPAGIDTLTLRLLAKDPAQRAPSIETIEHQLAELAGTAPDTSVEPRFDPVTSTQMAASTLSSAGSLALPGTGPTLSPRRRWRVGAIGAAVIAVAAISSVSIWSGKSGEPGPAPGPRRIDVPPADAALPPDAPVAPADAALADWLEAANPFVDWHGARWLAHQVTRREYHQFLESMPAGDALRLQPVNGWNDRDPMRPVTWVTYDRAAAFCRAIHASLPSSEQWQAASGGDWGLDPAGTGHPGPLREWTSTIQDGLVVVRGGHERMSPADRRVAATDPLMKSSEAVAGPDPAPNVVASETIGFRCVR